jgi:hypothetical protein
MDRIIDFLCPDLSYVKLRKRCKILKQQMNRQVPSEPVPQIQQNRLPICDVCKNEDEGNTVIDDAQGIRICLGPDGMGCGVVDTGEQVLSLRISTRLDIVEGSEQFSDQYSL